ncbi:MAG: riboflavin synthase [Candidatus Melainabacteria bacterium]|nr:riboflavin synthase [Candidatus Melainabacteria bacterium]
MFSGIIEEIGSVTNVKASSDGSRFSIKATNVFKDIAMGESISVNGTCLTVIAWDEKASTFDVEASHQTLNVTNLGKLKAGEEVNLEKALKVSDRLGGHIVSGHVDTTATLKSIREDGFARFLVFSLDKKWSPYFIEKGSVTVNGISLTVVDFPAQEDGNFAFSVCLIPHTLEMTTMKNLAPGAVCNIECDIMAKYLVRLLAEGYLENLNKVGQNLPIS